ncbi:butyrophilin-like protein 2 isoform X2 [Thunnus maccoyii]|uniref:butyrophilin-like protein 2 isoform X2 n=1 Tax=Thunnus maccoyii TaxID=8240 RepID=UPI001C4B9722|nr:butyrophilin-like protein 2 isoform X2 [Thunnus maccoyii]
MNQLVFFSLLTLLAVSLGDGNGPGVKVIVEEGSDAILPCSLSTKEDIKFFDWRKDGQKKDLKEEVFMYNEGQHYNNGLNGQSERFKGRVSHFPDELKSGNTSIIIRNTKVADSGNYTCDFPLLQPSKTFIIWLVVSPTLKDRAAENIPGAAPKPYTMIGNATEDGVTMKCEVRGAFPEPKVEWQDSDRNVLPADEPQVSERGGRFYITLQTTVKETKTNRFYCVAKQENISHMVDAEITVPEKMFEECKVPGQRYGHDIGMWIGLFSLGCVFGVGGTVTYFKCFKKRAAGEPRSQTANGHAVQMLAIPPEDPEAV